ncbi:MAG: TfoX/Sxy family protein [Burkholderiales bacterium]|jgi:DNA transformation protein|nr:TfoX/Sxy family protein [Burkholderiales bacterium]
MLQNDHPLKGLANIGPTIAARFSEVGISTVGDLRRVGVAKAYQMIRVNNPDKHIPVCYYLYSLEGALRGVHWDALSEQTKRKLRREADALAKCS